MTEREIETGKGSHEGGARGRYDGGARGGRRDILLQWDRRIDHGEVEGSDQERKREDVA